MKRDDMLKGLTGGSAPWDIIIIGGGATGLGTAVDAAARGYRTLLLEQNDFAKGTSSRSTKLIHGDRKSTRLNSRHTVISYAVFCLEKKNNTRLADYRAVGGT